jgi:acyl-CoA synthetase (AMP-forming)/AMP-acid ligase II
MALALLHRGLRRTAARLGDRPAILADDHRWTFAELDALSDAFGRRLVEAGVGAGGRVALMSSNRVEFPVAVQGISRVGAAAVLVSPAWRAGEVAHALALTSPCCAVADGEAVAVLRGQLDQVLDLDELDLRDDCGPLHEPAIALTDESVLVFSSGTTGLPKAVRHSHASLGTATEHWVDVLGLGSDDRFQVATPPSHILGLLNLLAAAEAGASVRLHKRFDLEEILGRIAEERMTLEMAVAPIALAMANHPHLEDYDLSSLRYILWGATPVTPSVAESVTRRTGARWLPGYGASELPVIACNPVRDPGAWRLDAVGIPPGDVQLRVVDLDTGGVLPAGEVGEIQARSPSLMIGYLPEEDTAEAFVQGRGPDGSATGERWYRTGDVGWLAPDGWVHLTDRCREMIKVNGFQVAPAELEAVLHGHPDVVDCAVFGVPDERTGEAPIAAVQVDPTHPVDPVELEQLVAASLATYKRLRAVTIVDTIPILPTGKVLRRTLRDEWARSHDNARKGARN